ncbi:MAG: NADH:flavin oxidoreductase/NADH oxidase [Opitutaceae bacterium]|nr:NADH:flavin oxidoreductase/NADH oxidase [Opitutaceae bacterium]
MSAASLFSPLTLRSVCLRNRIGLPPMAQYSAIGGHATDWHVIHYGSRAIGGAGLVIVEDTAVEPEGRISPVHLGIWDDRHIASLERVSRAIAENGAVPGIQIDHAGRKASRRPPGSEHQLALADGGWPTVAPSAVPLKADERAPREITHAEIERITASFRAAAGRALRAGFKVLEVHSAHGFLNHQFLSPLANRRTDEFGGSFENRTRFLRGVVGAIRKVWPDELPLFVRISATDWIEGGWNEGDSVELTRILGGLGVDLIDVSTGGIVPDAKIPVAPGYQVRFADLIRREAGIKTAAVGLITDPRAADEIVSSGRADLVLVGRELLRNPYWPLHAARTLGQPADIPTPYHRAFPAVA